MVLSIHNGGRRSSIFRIFENFLAQAKNASAGREHGGAISPSAALGKHSRALDQAIESYIGPNNDPY